MSTPDLAARQRRRESLVLAAAVAAVALAGATFFVWPLFASTWYENHDMVAYPVRAVEYVAGWRSGAWWPRWAPDLYGGYGCPLFNFYAPGLFIISGFFMLWGASATLALKLTLVLFTALGGACTFGAVYGESKRADAGLVAAVIFVFMGYHLTLVFVRGDLAEYSAICLTPAVVWGYRALGRVAPSRMTTVALATAFAHAATLLVHTLTGQWCTEFLLVIVGLTAWRSWRRGDRARAAALAATFVCACGLTAIYSVPALLDRPLVHIERMTAGGLATTHNLVDLESITPRGFFYIGWALKLLPVVVILALARHRRLLIDVIGWATASALMVLLMMHISEPVWQWLPFGSYIQFPWRLLGFLSLFGALAWGAAWRWLVPSRGVIAWPLAVVVAVAVSYDGWSNLPKELHALAEARVPQSATEIAHGIHSTVISDEYLPRTFSMRPMVPTARYVIAADHASVDLSLRSGTGYKLDVGGEGGGFVDLGVLWFPGWRVTTRSGPAKATIGPSPLGYVRVTLPAKGYYGVLLRFGLTPSRAAATAASFLSLALLVVAMRQLRRRARLASEELA